MVQTTGSRDTYGNSTVQSLKDKARGEVDKAGSQLEDAANTVAEKGREASDSIQAVADNMKQAFDKSLRDQPMTTLAMTAAVAFVIGAIWKS